MEFNDIWESVTYLRNEDEEITAVQVPIAQWRALLDRVQAMQDRESARQRLAKLRQTQDTEKTDKPKT